MVKTMPKKPVDITPEGSYAPVYLEEPTSAELAQQQAENDARVEAEELAKTQRQAKLDSALTKLKALGLTEAEAKVVIGIE
jgi:hypothetical protein